MKWEVVLWLDSEAVFFSGPLSWSDCESVYYKQKCFMSALSGDFISCHDIQLSIDIVSEV